MAKTQNRLYNSDHKELGKELPLKQPYVLLVDPSSLCNLRCRFCPTGDPALIKETGRYQGNMSVELFKKIIDDLQEFPEPINVLRLYKEGEPLMNPDIFEMIRYAKRSGCIKKVDITTNGVLLNPELNRRLIESWVDRINISVNTITKKYVDNIRDLYEHKGDCEIYIKGIQELLTIEEQDRFFWTFGSIADKIFLEHISPAWPGFKLDHVFDCGHYGQKIEERRVCPYIFYIMVVNADGTVSSCVGDWQHKLIYGDVRGESVRHIWNNYFINFLRTYHLIGRRLELEVCKDCQVLSHGTLDNIDRYAGDILSRMK